MNFLSKTKFHFSHNWFRKNNYGKGTIMKTRNTPSGLSIAIKSALFSNQNSNSKIIIKNSSEFSIKVANTLAERESVFQLAYQVYLDKRYIKENPNEWLVQSYDSNSETVILIVQDKQKNTVGSVTLVFDGSSRLPAEKIYGNELKTLRNQNEKIVEISRIVIAPDYRNSKEILILLFNYLHVYSYRVKKYTCLAIEVNPRHTAYYKALLHFRVIGEEKPCPNVQNAPAILMFLPLTPAQQEVKKITQFKQIEKSDRSLYHYFLKPEQENLATDYLKNQVKAITAEEKNYFGFSESGFSRAVCI